MPEDVFRIVVTIAVALASLAFVVQAGASLALYRVARKLQEKAAPLMERAEPVIGKMGPMVDKVGPILDATHQIIEDSRPRIANFSDEAVGVVKATRLQVEHVGELLTEASGRARDRLEQIDKSVENTVEQVEQVGEAVKRAVMRPVREANGIAAGVSAAVASLVNGPRRSSVDHATQDEEMFI